MVPERYSHGHHESVLRSHRWRTAKNSAGFLLARLRPDARVLDVGCGPGTITVDLATRVPTGQVLGIDIVPEVLDSGRALARARDVTNVTFAVGDAYDMEIDDASFDVVYAHQVLQHLREPVRALSEMRRVLVPGGLLAVRESDYGAFTWAPADPRLDEWMAAYHLLTARNGATADAGRFLHVWVRSAGFTDREVTASTWTYARPEERQWWGELWADRVTQSAFATQCLEYGIATPADLERFATAFRAWSRDEDGCFHVPSDEVLARA